MMETINHFIKIEEAKDNDSADDLNRYQNMLTKKKKNFLYLKKRKKKMNEKKWI